MMHHGSAGSSARTICTCALLAHRVRPVSLLPTSCPVCSCRMINVGAVLAQVGVAYVQQEVNFWCGYLIPTGVMILCTLIYVLSRKQFVQEDPGGSVVVKACKVLHATSWCCCCACFPCCRRRPPGSSRMTLRTEDTGDSWLDAVKGQYESEIVDNVKQVGSVLPVLASFCFFWTVQTEVSAPAWWPHSLAWDLTGDPSLSRRSTRSSFHRGSC